MKDHLLATIAVVLLVGCGLYGVVRLAKLAAER